MGTSTLNKKELFRLHMRKELFRLHMREVEEDYATLMGDCEYYESQIESLQNENDTLRELHASKSNDWMILNDGLFEIARELGITYEDTNDVDSDELWMNNLEAVKQLQAENAKLRKAAGDAWSLFVRFGAVHPYNLPEVDRVRESLQELGIEVKDD